MRGTQINLATRPLGNQLLPGLVLGLLLLAALACTVANFVSYTTHARAARAFALKVDASKQEIARLEEERTELNRMIREENAPILARNVAAANSLLRHRGFSWTGLFNDLEKVQPYRVQLQSVVPKVDNNSVTLTITGEAENYDDFLNYIDRTEASPAFSRVFPRNEGMTERKAFRFSMVMLYHPQPAGGADRGEG